VEVLHLLPKHDTTFDLIKLFSNTLFHPNNIIYTWGYIKELAEFIKFGLYTDEQIYLSQNINCQSGFKKYWKQNNPHKLSSVASTED
jgi:hypothetical protein